MSDVNATLKQRGNVHGNFAESAEWKDAVKQQARSCPSWPHMNAAERCAFDMIIEKLGRVLYGNPDFADHWHDIAGYATLVDNHLTRDEPEEHNG